MVASWARYAEGVDEQGEPIEVVDRLADRLMATARGQREDPLAFLADREVFGDLVDDERFTTRLPAAPRLALRARRPGDAGEAGLRQRGFQRASRAASTSSSVIVQAAGPSGSTTRTTSPSQVGRGHGASRAASASIAAFSGRTEPVRRS